MPKRVEGKDAAEWLKMFRAGKSESRIAKETRHDLRTVKAAIQKLIAEEDQREVRKQAFARSFDRHLGELLKLLEVFGRRARSGPPDKPVVSVFDIRGRVTGAAGLSVTRSDSGEYQASLPDALEWRLAAQHLKGDSMWLEIQRLLAAAAKEAQSEAGLAARVVRELRKASGLPVSDEENSARVPLSGADLVCRHVFDQAVSHGDSLERLIDHLRPDERGGGLWYSGQAVILTEGPVRDAVRDQVLKVLKNAGRWKECAALAEARTELAQLCGTVGEQSGILAHGGFLPGACDACKRFRL